MVDQVVFWLFVFAGAVLAGWWLAMRPGATFRDVATPVSFLVLTLAVLLCMLALTGQDIEGFTTDVYQFTLGR